jgi:hypothetical protein
MVSVVGLESSKELVEGTPCLEAANLLVAENPSQFVAAASEVIAAEWRRMSEDFIACENSEFANLIECKIL